MREIKFRAWDTEKSEYYKPIHEAYKGNLSELLVGFSGQLVEHNMKGIAHESMFPDRYILEQFTGLMDKNGTEIYEGDRISDGNSEHVVEYLSERFEVSHGLGTIGGGFDFGDCWDIKKIEVIGNIHQTKNQSLGKDFFKLLND